MLCFFAAGASFTSPAALFLSLLHTHLGPGRGRLTRKRVSCHAQTLIQGGVWLNPLWHTPLRTTLATLAGARCSAKLTSFCPEPSKHLGKPANGSPGREAQRGGTAGPACAQGSPVRCGYTGCRQATPAAVVRARTHTSSLNLSQSSKPRGDGVQRLYASN